MPRFVPAKVYLIDEHKGTWARDVERRLLDMSPATLVITERASAGLQCCVNFAICFDSPLGSLGIRPGLNILHEPSYVPQR
jgi:hypothetical protein